MPHEAFWLPTETQCPLYVHQWLPTTPIKACVLLIHGMAEHAGRYQRLGQALNQAGYALLASDLRGHGRSAESGTLGLFAEHDGWQTVLNDLALLHRHIGQRFPATPLFIFGHSMGSYLAQAYLMQHSARLCGAVLSGSNYQPAALYRAAALIARLETWRQGKLGQSLLIERLSFGAFNKAFKPPRTAFDWLSRDAEEVDRYLADPLCGFRCRNQLWLDLMHGLAQISRRDALAQIDRTLPMLVIGGECDPVSAGKRLNHLAHALRATGHRQVTLRVYPGARHELLNEINRETVTADILNWLEHAQALGRPARNE
ncbi:alpha/beta hydrolase [Pseudomonas sp. RP23018S]|uniref:alpha/beta hydrolase n=1 Tax=Pseudomonas sp. RP23018S TaxID=3096037 RepID=UPI002ACAF522|nr:alpha/beta hydrolase [Pseudomonas sp. RP23018S]MDZ5601960.1 alpha/beta hydrolase [Pseudomonas sp. RP23018S]